MATRAESDPKGRIKELKSKFNVTENQLRQEITPDDHILAGCFADYDIFMGKLGLTESEKKDTIVVEHEHGSQSAMRKALTLWHKKNPLTATYKALVKIALDLKDGQTANNICQYIKSNEHVVAAEKPITATDNEGDDSLQETTPLVIHEPFMAEHSSYHGVITGKEAAHRLKEVGTRCYLTRYSRTQRCYILTVYEQELIAEHITPGIQDIKIVITQQVRKRVNRYQVGAREFDNPDKMLRYYEKNRIDPGLQDIGRCITKREYFERQIIKNINPELHRYYADQLREIELIEQRTIDSKSKCSIS